MKIETPGTTFVCRQHSTEPDISPQLPQTAEHFPFAGTNYTKPVNLGSTPVVIENFQWP